MDRRTAAIGDFVTKEMFAQIKEIGPDADRIAREVLGPHMEEIDRKLGQENDPKYLAYAIIHALHQCNRGS